MDHPLWDRLPADVRERVDALILEGRKLHAIKAARDAFEAPRPSLYDCQDLIVERHAALGRRYTREPTPPLALDALAAQVQGLPGPLAAIEAVWDGDTEGWFVLLFAVSLAPKTEHHLATVQRGTDMRLFNGQVPPWPEAEEASRVGAALADRLGVPFHFASPDEPDCDVPRWWDTL